MSDTQPYSLHKAPPIMGLTQWDFNDFQDMLVKANNIQLEAMERKIKEEIKKREK